MNTPDRRALALAALLTFAVAALVGVLSVLTALAGLVTVYFDPVASGPAALLASWVVYGFLALVGVGYVVIPTVVGVALVRSGLSRRYAAAWSGVAVFLPATALAAVVAVVTYHRSEVYLLVPVVLLAVVVAGHSLSRSRHGDREVPWEVFGNLALVAVVLVGLYAGVVGATGAVGGLVETERSYGSVSPGPQVTFDYSYRPVGDGQAVVTITHGAGDTLDASNVTVGGELVHAAGANQTEAGPWQGSTSVRDGDRVVTRGDSVAVGVRSDCEDLRVLWRGPDGSVPIGIYDCPASR